MSYDAERKAIETYIGANWDATPIGFDGHPFTPEFNTILLTINSGQRIQGSIGRTLNRVDHIGTLVVSIYTEGGKGSMAWRGYAETMIDLLHGVTLDDEGAPITTTADAFLRFSPVTPRGRTEQHPYISASFPDAPFHIANITAPFTRYEYI